jgi:hypothetical protein
VKPEDLAGYCVGTSAVATEVGATPCAILILETKYNDGSVESAVSDSQTQTTLKMLGVLAKKLQKFRLQMK